MVSTSHPSRPDPLIVSGRFADERGMSLMELVLAMGIMLLLGGMVTVAVPSSIEAAREASATAQLGRVKEGMIGERFTTAAAGANRFGFLGDIGRLPATLDELANIGSLPDYAVDPVLQVGAGWRGPYVSTFPSDSLVDPWNNDLVLDAAAGTSAFSGAPIVAEIRSMGPDATDETADDFTMELHTSEVEARVFGYAVRSTGDPMTDLDVDLTVPVNGTLSTSSTTTDSSGFYEFADIPHGERVVSPSPGIAYRPGSAATSGGNNRHVEFVVENLGASAVSLTSLTATYAVTAYYRVVRIDGNTVFNNQNPRAGSGTLIPFPAEVMTPAVSVPDAATVRVISSAFQVPDFTVGPAGGSLFIELRNFRQNPMGAAPTVNMSGVTFTILFSDGSTIQFTTP